MSKTRTRRSNRKMETRTHANRTFAKKRMDRKSLVATDCQRVLLCPQACDMGELPGNPAYIPLFDQDNLQQNGQDSVRLHSLSVRMYLSAWVEAEQSTTLTLLKHRDAAFLARMMLCKQQAQVSGGVLTGLAAVNPLDDTEWVDVPAIKRWEKYHDSEAHRYGGDVGGDNTDTFTAEVHLDGTVESCCSVGTIGGGGGIITVVGGEGGGVVEPVLGEITCTPCTGTGPDNLPAIQLDGVIDMPAQSGSRQNLTVRPLPTWTWSMFRKAPIVLRENDNLALWLNYTGLGIMGNEECSQQGVPGIPVGLRIYTVATATIEW